jgi:hypothetical protein
MWGWQISSALTSLGKDAAGARWFFSKVKNISGNWRRNELQPSGRSNCLTFSEIEA